MRIEGNEDTVMGSAAKANLDISEVPVVERVAAVMQSDPDLWGRRVYVSFTGDDHVVISLHHIPWDVVHEMASAFTLSVEPYHVMRLSSVKGEGPMVSVRFGDRRNSSHGITLVWFINEPDARLLLGEKFTDLLGP